MKKRTLFGAGLDIRGLNFFFLFFLFFVHFFVFFLVTTDAVLAHLIFKCWRRCNKFSECTVTDHFAVAQKDDFVCKWQVLQLICGENDDLVGPILLDRLFEQVFAHVGIDCGQRIV